MSAETLRAIDAAIHAHVADENDGQVAAGWVINVYSESLHDGSSYYQSVVPETQPWHATNGLVRLLAAEYKYPPYADGDDD